MRRGADERPGRPHVVVFSSGRSGSNRLLDLFDQHERTNCRNEIDSDDPVINAIKGWDAAAEAPEALAARWQDAVRRAALRKGRRDRYDLGHKAWLRPGLAPVWAAVYRRRRLRRPLAGRGGRDWPVPGLVLRADAARSVLPVLKISRPPEPFLALHGADPGLILVHNLREPRGYLRSWYNRLVLRAPEGPEGVYATLRARLAPRMAGLGRPPLPEAFSLRALLVAELWQWRLNNEPLAAGLAGAPRYLQVSYDRVSGAPVETARRLYAHAGLDFTAAHAARVEGLRNTLFPRPHRAALAPDLVEAALAEVLEDGPLARLFPPAASEAAAGAPPAEARA